MTTPNAMRDALQFYFTTYCEGWCKSYPGPSTTTFKDCGGCKARAALSTPVPPCLQKAQTTAAVPSGDGASPLACAKCGMYYCTHSIDERLPAISPSPAVAAEPVNMQPDYEAAARALGYQQLASGSWWHPNQHPNFTERFKKAEDIFELYFGKHWPASPPVRRDRETFYTILKKYIPQEPIDQAWQELKEAGLVK